MKYAVIETGSKQYKVAEGDVITVDKLPVDTDGSYVFPRVLLVVDNGQPTVGNPYVSDIPVTGKILEHTKGEKIRVARFRAKSRYRKVRGFRSSITKVKIESIGVEPETENGKKVAKRKTPVKTKTTVRKKTT